MFRMVVVGLLFLSGLGGISLKLEKENFPSGHGPDDFKCFGPPAIEDGQFDGTYLADMGCFTQDGKDSNKYYNCCVCQSKKNGKWYAYFEWGRTGAAHPSFQMIECSSKEEAHREYSDQLHSKNDKRGQWITLAGRKVLTAKPGKDCYLIRPQATRSTGLPDSKTIVVNDKASVPQPSASVKRAKGSKQSSARRIDTSTSNLLRALKIETASYTRSSLSSSSLPTQAAIEEARDYLSEAEKRLLVVGDDEDDQAGDKELIKITNIIYSRIPRVKSVGAAAATWVLSKNNILQWRMDLDAYESSLQTGVVATATGSNQDDALKDMDLEMEEVPLNSSLGSWLVKWMTIASKNTHRQYGNINILNAWKVLKPSLVRSFESCLSEVNAGSRPDKPLFQPSKRPDVEDPKMYDKSNTCLLMHGSRSVNILGILQKSLMLPKQLVGVSINGAMWGAGNYFADDWRKSAGYCSLRNSYWAGGSGAIQGRKAFMFIADVVLGRPFVPSGSCGYTAAPSGHHSVYAKGNRSGVINNEFIVYRKPQHMLRYLVEFEA